MSNPPAKAGRRRRTLVGEILLTQLGYAALVGVTALVSVWSMANWVVRGNLEDWSEQWIAELDTLGVGLFQGEDVERYLKIESYIAKFPEIRFVRYYSTAGELVHFESFDREEPAAPPLGESELAALRDIATEPQSYHLDRTSLEPLVRLSTAVQLESIKADGLFGSDSLEDLATRAEVVGFVELGLDFTRYDNQLITSAVIGCLVMLGVIALLAGVGRLLLKDALRPLSQIQQSLTRLADGELDFRAPETPHHELAVIAAALETAVTKVRERDQRLRRLANYDALTGLPNRHHLTERLTAEVERIANASTTSALLFVDLDQFKYVNDTVGHTAGDAVLVQAAERIRVLARADDAVGRFGGDEFALLRCDASVEDALKTAENLMRNLREFPLAYGRQSFNILCSIGITMITPRTPYTPSELMSQADLACQEAKSEGRNRIRVYEAADGALETIETDMGWLKRLRDALAHDLFVLHYQPIMSIESRTTAHYEVLIRVREGDQLHYPGAFLAAAARFGLMRDIDHWVIRHAFAELAAVHRRDPDVRFTLNLSGGSFADGDLPAFVNDQLTANALPASAVILEITEQVAIGSMSDALAQIQTMIDLGCEFAIDDFGAGYSSLNYLKRLPVQYVKIDGIFIENLADSEVDQLIVRAIANIARAIGKQTVAEFVGDLETLDLLREFGVDFAQGFYVGMPGPSIAARSADAVNARRRRRRRVAGKR